MPGPVPRAVTMLFTDIEGSTRAARALGARWPAVLGDHHRLVKAAIEGAGGQVEDTAGDSVFAVFGDPVAAGAAAGAAQRSLGGHPGPAEIAPLAVRMGLHTGVVERSSVELTGLDIHLAARV